MNVLVVPSAYYALADADAQAQSIFQRFVEDEHELWSTPYVVLETAALVQARLGLEALKLFRESLASSTTVIWIDPEFHNQAWDELERIGRRQVSLTAKSANTIPIPSGAAVAGARAQAQGEIGMSPDFGLDFGASSAP